LLLRGIVAWPRYSTVHSEGSIFPIGFLVLLGGGHDRAGLLAIPSHRVAQKRIEFAPSRRPSDSCLNDYLNELKL
jgi:hypothetical protein